MTDQLLTMFVANPWLALIPSVLLFWLSKRTILRSAFFAALLWAAYFLYELAIWYQLPFVCENGCDLRVDLVIIYPVLAAVTLFALVKFFMKVYNRNSH